MVGLILTLLWQCLLAFPWLAIPLYGIVFCLVGLGVQKTYELLRYSKQERLERRVVQQAHLDTIYTKAEQHEGKASLIRCFWFAAAIEVPLISYLALTGQLSAASVLVAIAIILPAAIVYSLVLAGWRHFNPVVEEMDS